MDLCNIHLRLFDAEAVPPYQGGHVVRILYLHQMEGDRQKEGDHRHIFLVVGPFLGHLWGDLTADHRRRLQNENHHSCLLEGVLVAAEDREVLEDHREKDGIQVAHRKEGGRIQIHQVL